jgi:hypothetical protein
MSSREQAIGGAFEHDGVTFTIHAGLCLAQRRLSAEDVEYVLEHGHRLRRTGVEFCVLRSRDIPPADRRVAGHLEGTVVLVADNGVAITVYRNRRALAEIRRKAKYRRPVLWRDSRAA